MNIRQARPAGALVRYADPPEQGRVRRRALVFSFLFAVSLFALTGPGRIDSIDGQYRFEVARALIIEGVPALSDPFLARLGHLGVDGRTYITYGPAPSYVALPLVWIGSVLGDQWGELARFLFSWLNAIAMAGTVCLLSHFYLELGVLLRRATFAAFAAALGSLLWIGATTVLEQGQHAFFGLAAVYLGWRAAQRRSTSIASLAGLAAGTLLLYQPSYLLHQPALALATLDSGGSATPSWLSKASTFRYFAFGTASLLSLFTLLLYNWNRFGEVIFFPNSDPMGHPSPLGNPLIGIATLLLSPGKGVFFFSPIVVLCLYGLRRLRSREPQLVAAIIATSLVHLALIGSLSFFHGDWCWGPRYLIVLIPLLAIGLPFALEGASAAMRRFAVVVICLGVFSNVLGLSLVHERFFHEKGLAIYFWKDDPGFYWRESNYFHRFGEIARTLRDGMPPEATTFTNSPYPGLLTYVFTRGGPPQVDAPWMRRYRIFYRPRPWPLWLAAEKENWARGEGFPAFWWLVGGLVAAGAAGAGLTWSAIRESERAVPTADSD